MESKPQTDTIQQLMEELSLSDDRAKDCFYLTRQLRRVEEERDGLLRGERAMARALERPKGDLASEVDNQEQQSGEGGAPFFRWQHHPDPRQLSPGVCSLNDQENERLQESEDLIDELLEDDDEILNNEFYSHIRAMETKLEELDCELHEKNRLLRDKEDECENLKKKVEEQDEDFKTNLEIILDQVKRSKEEMEMMMGTKLTDEERYDMKSECDQAASEPNSQVYLDDYENLLEENEKLINHIRALETKQQQLDCELCEKDRLLRDKEDECESLKKQWEIRDEGVTTANATIECGTQTLWVDSESSGRSSPSTGVSLKLLDENEKLSNRVEALETKLCEKDQRLRDKEDKRENLKKEVEEKEDDRATARTNLEIFLDDVEGFLDNLVESQAVEKRSNADLETRIEPLNNQARALETKQQLDCDLCEKDRRMRDKEDQVLAMKWSLQLQCRVNERLQESEDLINDLLQAYRNLYETYNDHMDDCMIKTQYLRLDGYILRRDLDLKEDECETLKKELEKRDESVTIAPTERP